MRTPPHHRSDAGAQGRKVEDVSDDENVVYVSGYLNVSREWLRSPVLLPGGFHELFMDDEDEDESSGDDVA